MPKKIKKISSFLFCFLLIFQQAGFSQVAAELNIAGHLASLHNSFVSDTFRPLHLRYLSFNPLDNNFKLLLDKGSLKNPTGQEVQDASKTLMQYFLIGLTLPNDTFWVNLRPDSPDQIIDDRLAQTDIGMIMLETDLQLKKDTASFTSPQTPEGRKYWNKLYKKAEELYGTETVTIPTLTRPWIVPGEIIIRETTDSAYIYKATLKVMLEQDYLKNTPNVINAGAADYSFKDQRSKALNEYSTQLIRELIIPKLTKEVNSSKRYAGLRQVYYSLIMAQWFKTRHKQGQVSVVIDSQNLTNLASKQNWSKTTYFNAYKKSFTEGEYNIQEPHYTPTGQVIRSYFSGGELLAGASSAMVVIPGSSRSPVSASSSLMSIDYPSASSSSIKEVTPPAAGSAIAKEAKASSTIITQEKRIKQLLVKNIGIKNSMISMFTRAIEENPFIQTALSDLGCLGQVGRRLESLKKLDEVYLKEKHRVDILPFELSEKGRLFFKELFSVDPKDLKVYLATITIPKRGIAIPYAFTLEDTKDKKIYHLQVLELSCVTGNKRLKRVPFMPDNPAPYRNYRNVSQKNLYRQLNEELIKARPGYEVEGAIFNLPEKKFFSYDPDAYWTERYTRRYSVHLLYLTQPPLTAHEAIYRSGPGGYIPSDADKYDKDIVMNPSDPYHEQFMGVVKEYGDARRFKDKDLGIIGTGQGADIIEALFHKPHSVRANDISALAVMVSEWNLRLAGEMGIISKEIPVEIVQAEGINGIGDPDVVVWHTPAIISDTIIENIAESGRSMDKHNLSIFGLSESYFRNFLKTLVALLNNTDKFALLRLDIEPGLRKNGEKESEAVDRYLSEAGLKGRISLQGIWEVKKNVDSSDLPGTPPAAGSAIKEQSSQSSSMHPWESLIVGGFLPETENSNYFSFHDIHSNIAKNALLFLDSYLKKENLRDLIEGKDIILLGGTLDEFEQVAKRCSPLAEKFHIVNIDTYKIKQMAKFAYDRMGEIASEKFAFYNRDISSLKDVIQDGSMALAVNIGVLEFVDGKKAIKSIEEMVRVLAPGGIGIVQDLHDTEIRDLRENLPNNVELLTDDWVKGMFIFKKKASSSIKNDSVVGGIDFRSLPIVTQAVSNLSANLRDSPLQRVNLDVEWQQIERMASSGIKPSPERIREYAQASSSLGRISQDRDKIILCISDTLRQEEEECCETDSVLRDILVVLESVQQPQELKKVFLGKV